MPSTYQMKIKRDEITPTNEEILKLKNINIKIGLFGSGKIEENVAERGAKNELGTKEGTPSRPFMRMAFDNNLEININSIQKLYKNFVKGKGKTETKQLISKIGVLFEGQIKKTIKTGNFEPLSIVTIEKKGSTRPLIDTGVMLNSVKYQIIKRGF